MPSDDHLAHISDTLDVTLIAVVVVGMLVVFFLAASYVRGMRG